MSNCTDGFGLFKNNYNQWKTCSWLDLDWKLRNNCGVGVYGQTELGGACRASCWLYNGCSPPSPMNSTLAPTGTLTRYPIIKASAMPSKRFPVPTNYPRHRPTVYPTKIPSPLSKSENIAFTKKPLMHPTIPPTSTSNNATVVDFGSTRPDVTIVYSISLGCTFMVLFLALIVRSLIRKKKNVLITEAFVQNNDDNKQANVIGARDDNQDQIVSKTNDSIGDVPVISDDSDIKVPHPVSHDSLNRCDWLVSSCRPPGQEGSSVVNDGMKSESFKEYIQGLSMWNLFHDKQERNNISDKNSAWLSSSKPRLPCEDNQTEILPKGSPSNGSRVGFWENVLDKMTLTPFAAPQVSTSKLMCSEPVVTKAYQDDTLNDFRSWFESPEEFDNEESSGSKSDVESHSFKSSSYSSDENSSYSSKGNRERTVVPPESLSRWKKILSTFRPICFTARDSTDSSSLDSSGNGAPLDHTWSSFESETFFTVLIDESRRLFHITSSSHSN